MPNNAEVIQFRHDIVKNWLVKVKNVVFDGREKKVFVSSKMEEAIQLLLFSLFHYPLSFYESFFISEQKFRSIIVLKDNKKILKFRAL